MARSTQFRFLEYKIIDFDYDNILDDAIDQIWETVTKDEKLEQRDTEQYEIVRKMFIHDLILKILKKQLDDESKQLTYLNARISYTQDEEKTIINISRNNSNIKMPSYV